MFTAFGEVPAAVVAVATEGFTFPGERSTSSKNRATRFPVSGGWDAPWNSFFSL